MHAWIGSEYWICIDHQIIQASSSIAYKSMYCSGEDIFVMTDRLLGRVASQSIKLFKIAKLSHRLLLPLTKSISSHITPLDAHEFPCPLCPFHSTLPTHQVWKYKPSMNWCYVNAGWNGDNRHMMMMQYFLDLKMIGIDWLITSENLRAS